MIALRYYHSYGQHFTAPSRSIQLGYDLGVSTQSNLLDVSFELSTTVWGTTVLIQVIKVYGNISFLFTDQVLCNTRGFFESKFIS